MHRFFLAARSSKGKNGVTGETVNQTFFRSITLTPRSEPLVARTCEVDIQCSTRMILCGLSYLENAEGFLVYFPKQEGFNELRSSFL